MELLTVKLIVLVLMGVFRVACGMLPLAIVKMIRGRWSKVADRRLKKCISVLVFFGGGVMLATCFLHMMPEVNEIFTEALPQVHLPIPQIIFVMGFFLVYMIEDIVHAFIHKRKSKKRAKKLRKGQEEKAIEGGNRVIALPYNNNESPAVHSVSVIGGKEGDYLNGGFCYNTYQDDETHHHNYRKTSTPVGLETKRIFDKNVVRKCEDIPGLPKTNSVSTMNIQSKQEGNIRAGNGKFSYIDPEWFRDTVIANSQADIIQNNRNRLDDLQLSKAEVDDSKSNSSSGSTSCSRKKLHEQKKDDSSLEQEDDDHNHYDHEHSHIPVAFVDGDDELDQSIGAEIRNLLIVIAISFHGVFEGLAIGLQDSVEDVWYMFFAVSLHECTILFCIGIELISNNTKVMKMVLYVLIVSLVSPVGIGIGIAITEKSFGTTGGAHALVVGSFQGLAAGSLLYVTFFEIFQEEGRKLSRKYVHILVAILGFVLMGCLEFAGGHTHGGSKNSPHTHNHSHGNTSVEPHDHSDHDHGHNETDEHHHHHDDDHFHEH